MHVHKMKNTMKRKVFDLFFKASVKIFNPPPPSETVIHYVAIGVFDVAESLDKILLFFY